MSAATPWDSKVEWGAIMSRWPEPAPMTVAEAEAVIERVTVEQHAPAREVVEAMRIIREAQGVA